MDPDWDEVARTLLPASAPDALPTPIAALAFDNTQELLWTGNDYGRITSFHGKDLQKYTSYRGHPRAEGPVKQLLLCDRGVLSISSKSVHLANRRGLTQWHLSVASMTDLTCMVMTSKSSDQVLVAGCQPNMYKIDIDKGTVTHALTAEASYTLMKRGVSLICAATTDGTVHIMDPTTCTVSKTWKAHSSWINDMDVRSEILITCGWSPRQQQGYMLDHLANVFDLKTLMPLPPLPFPPGAAFVRMHPKMSTTCIVASQTGLMYAVDIMNPDAPLMKHAHMLDTHLTSLDLASSGEALALADAQCTVHLWGSPTKVQIADFATHTDLADAAPPSMTMTWSSDTPLNMIGMPYYREQLLSAWPSHLVHEVGAPPVRIDPSLANISKRTDASFYAPWPRKTRRYQFEDTRALQRAQDSFAAPKFLSEKTRPGKDEVDGPDGSRRISDALEILGDLALDGVTRREVPVIYRNVEIKYSKFGVDDFDFEYYNKTKFSGLETHIQNSYANPLLQLIRFTPVLRNLALSHTATACLYDNCLLCEMGFLSDMLEKAAGLNCQASNFFKVFTSSPEAAGLGVHEEFAMHSPLAAMVQSTNRFLMGNFAASYRQMPPHSTDLDRSLTISSITSIRCNHCTSEMIKPGETLVHDLVYPLPKMHQRAPRPSFSQILKASVERQGQTRAWCDRCKRYQQLSTRKSVQRISDVIMMNTAIHSMDHRQLWSTPGWLPREIGIINSDGQFYCYEGQDLKNHLQRGVYDITVYELVGLVADINSGDKQKSHLVALIDVSHSSKEPATTNAASWHLFNDFLVRQLTPDEALRFDATWKMPCILTFQVKSASRGIDETWKERLDATLLFSAPRGPHEQPDTKALRPLSAGLETPQAGMVCGIDAEFVALSKAEIDIKADGTRETVRPPRLGAARISVLRGAGPDEGLPFIDDYIFTTDPVVDYLTAYSGINPGDLDRSTSRHNLVSLKIAYKKLWLLLNMGVIFVGHGLPKDFRTINIHVPRSQVVDTVDLFYHRVRSQRRLSLRFLAWFLLKEEIQQESSGHDSVEDALTALKLWRKYQEFVDAGIFESILEEIFDKGRETNFKPPSLLRAEREEDFNSGLAGMASVPGTPARRFIELTHLMIDPVHLAPIPGTDQPQHGRANQHSPKEMAANESDTMSPDETLPDEPSDMPSTMAASVVLDQLPRSAQKALEHAGELDRPKITVHFKTLPGTPSLGQPRFKISSTQRFEAVVRFLRRKLALADHESVFCYVNQVFAPGLDEGVGNLWRCFKTGDELVVNYGVTQAFG